MEIPVSSEAEDSAFAFHTASSVPVRVVIDSLMSRLVSVDPSHEIVKLLVQFTVFANTFHFLQDPQCTDRKKEQNAD